MAAPDSSSDTSAMLRVQQTSKTPTFGPAWVEMLSNYAPCDLPDMTVHKCNLCDFVCSDQGDYEAHLDTHFEFRCPFCDYTSKTEGRVKRHVKQLHKDEVSPSTSESDAQTFQDDDNSSSRPRENGQRKTRFSKCKHCGCTFESKTEFWQHTKTHIKDGKVLECPECAFVTEYKHHLEYHLRNHYGSKPFKCSKCEYSCVNKSMLNSHLKSHSSVYQYRCNDCSYATKYCHSLKLHLRKYSHKPAVVLNPDGTPNPYPIIDVYGTRRGPRPKKSPVPAQSQNDQSSKIWDPMTSAASYLTALPYSLRVEMVKQARKESRLRAGMQALTDSMKATRFHPDVGLGPEKPCADGPLDLSRASTESPPSTASTFFPSMLLQRLPLSPPLFQLPQLPTILLPLQLSPTRQSSTPNTLPQSPPPMTLPRSPPPPLQLSSSSPSIKLSRSPPPMQLSPPPTRLCTLAQESPPKQMPPQVQDAPPLQMAPHAHELPSVQMSSPYEHEPPPPPPPPVPPVVSPPKPPDRVSSSASMTSPGRTSSPVQIGRSVFASSPVQVTPTVREPSPVASVSTQRSNLRSTSSSNRRKGRAIKLDSFHCEFCDMMFKDADMFSLHMDYHGSEDPFTCHFCGKETNNRLQFFCHLLRERHN